MTCEGDREIEEGDKGQRGKQENTNLRFVCCCLLTGRSEAADELGLISGVLMDSTNLTLIEKMDESLRRSFHKRMWMGLKRVLGRGAARRVRVRGIRKLPA